MSDETVLQFGRSLRDEAQPARASAEAQATSCPTCGSRFSPDGRFCPFDGTPLVPASGADPSKDPLVGRTIDERYEVLSIIGEGGMGTVYCVRHRALGKRFALKALRKDLASDAEIAARFIQEARTAAAVSHPGLVEITDFGRLGTGQVYFVMELLEGQSLAALLRRGGPLPAARGLDIVRQLASALKAAHDASIVHRDLKPENIHVGRGDGDRDRVKIVDFGLAKVIGSSRLTRAGMVFGTPHYMSPEQAAGEAVDHRADIYALGIAMYEMFTGKVPFEADSYMGVLTKHLYMTPAAPSTLSPDIKALGALDDVILRCLQKRPEARYENLAALLSDLDERLPRPARRAPPPSLLDEVELPTAVDARPRRSPVLLPIAVVAGAFLLGLGLVFALRPAPAPRTAVPPDPPLVALSASETPAPLPAPSVVVSASSETARSSAQSPLRAQAPARKPAATLAAPGPGRAGSATPKRRIGTGEIVDPWAR